MRPLAGPAVALALVVLAGRGAGQAAPVAAAPAAGLAAYRAGQQATRTATPRFTVPRRTPTALRVVATDAPPTATARAGATGMPGTAPVGPDGPAADEPGPSAGSPGVTGLPSPTLADGAPAPEVGTPAAAPGGGGGAGAAAPVGPRGIVDVPIDEGSVRAQWARFGSPREGQPIASRLTDARPGPWGWAPFYLLVVALLGYLLARLWRAVREVAAGVEAE